MSKKKKIIINILGWLFFWKSFFFFFLLQCSINDNHCASRWRNKRQEECVYGEAEMDMLALIRNILVKRKRKKKIATILALYADYKREKCEWYNIICMYISVCMWLCVCIYYRYIYIWYICVHVSKSSRWWRTGNMLKFYKSQQLGGNHRAQDIRSSSLAWAPFFSLLGPYMCHYTPLSLPSSVLLLFYPLAKGRSRDFNYAPNESAWAYIHHDIFFLPFGYKTHCNFFSLMYIHTKNPSA